MHFDRRTVDAVIHGIVYRAILIIIGLRHIQRRIRQVDDLTALPCGKKRSVTFGGSLYHFVLDRE